MTVAFDEKARHEMAQTFYAYDFSYDGTPVSDMVVKEIATQTARKCISSFHYSHTYPDSTLIAYGGFLNNKLCGVVCYGMGANKAQYTALIPDIENGEYAELTRLWCANDYPKNTESKLISASLKLLPPSIKLVISFADQGKGHLGTIYQATNFYYCGMYSGGGTTLVTKDGLKKHGRLVGIYKMRHPEYKDVPTTELISMLGYTTEKASPKYRYVYLRGTRKERKQMYNQIKDKIQQYPKGVVNPEKKTDAQMLGIEGEGAQITLMGLM